MRVCSLFCIRVGRAGAERVEPYDVVRFVLGWLGPALVLCSLSLSCAAPAALPTPSPAGDPFAVVRATAESAYRSGEAALVRGDYLQACVDLDAARTHDPDNRSDIQQAFEQALARCLTPPPAPTTAPPAASAAQQRTIVVATVAAGLGTALATNSTPATDVSASTNATRAAATASAPTSTPVVAAPAASATGSSGANIDLATWNDPQGRFSVAAPADWTRTDQPQTLVGTGVVEFHDPIGRAEVDISVDAATRAVSPELYAAGLELAMQQQVPGYASEQVFPGTTAGNPSVRRVFTFTQRDASGQDHQARAFQLTIVKGSTPYVISGSAPAEQYQQFSPAFDRIVESFRFS